MKLVKQTQRDEAPRLEIKIQTSSGTGVSTVLRANELEFIESVGEFLAQRILLDAAKAVSNGRAHEVDSAVVAWGVCMVDRENEILLRKIVDEEGGTARVVLTENSDGTVDVDICEVVSAPVQ